MLSALASSGLFLVSYLAYHFQVGSVRFGGQGPVRRVYFAVLISHTVLAVAVLPLVLLTVARARAARFEAHRALARVTLPFWLYVSLSGVVVYWMLYRM
jgi:putative membrane protein